LDHKRLALAAISSMQQQICAQHRSRAPSQTGSGSQ
jgi:hypothetical protein